MKTRKGYLIRRGRTFYAVWEISGRKYTKTTRQHNRRDAEKELSRIMAPYMIGDEVRVLESVKARIEGAKSELDKIDEERNPPLTLAGAWSAYKTATNRPDSGKATLREYESHMEQFTTWISETHRAAKLLRDVDRATAEQYAAHLLGRNLSGNRFNKHINCLALVFRVLADKARLTTNPWAGIQRRRQVAQSRRELTVDELKTVCARAAGELRTLFALGIYTGLRLGDCCTLRWGEVDLARRIIRRIPNKTSRRNPTPVLVPVHAALCSVLRDISTDKRGEYVLPELASLYVKGAYRVTDQVQAHFVACGINPYKPGTGMASAEKGKDGEPIPGTALRAVVEVGFHSLRHTFVSLCREANAPLSVVEAIVGHSNPAMTRHYTHTGDDAAAAAVALLPAIMGDVKALPAPASADPLATFKAELRGIVETITAKTWKEAKAALLARLELERDTLLK